MCYLLGQSTPDVCKAIEYRQDTDEAFATEVSFVRAFLHVEEEPHPASSSFTVPQSSNIRRKKSSRWLWRCAAGILIGICSLGMAWAGWELIRVKPLLEEHFHDNWGDLDLWRTPRRAVKVADGHVRLIDRGYLATTKEFPVPIKLTFRWQWNDLAGDFLYRDILSIALRTSGIPRQEHAFEISDGIVVVINATSGRVGITESGPRNDALKQSKKLKLPPHVWHDITITDDGSTIRVYVAAPHISQEESEKPVLEFSTPIKGNGHHIAFFNREPLARASFESWLDDILIQQLK